MRRGAALAGAAAAAFLLAGCSGFPWQSADEIPTPTPTPTPTIDSRPYTDLGAGDCYDSINASSAEVIGCAQPHTFEVFASFVLPDPEYPGDAMKAPASQQCKTAFAAFVGVDFDASALSLRYIGPSRATWGEGDREVLCVVFDPGQTTSGSLANTGR